MSSFLFIILLIITITTSVLLIIRFSRRQPQQSEGIFSPTLIGVKSDGITFDIMLNNCRELGFKIDEVSGRQNNSINCAELVYKISKELGYNESDALLSFAIALVYDAGLLSVPPELFLKDHLNSSEVTEIQQHVLNGGEYLDFVPDSMKEQFVTVIRNHHENMDGTGYPKGIRGEELNYLSRCIRVVDSYLSQVSNRTYRDITDSNDALKHLKSEITKYDPVIINALERVI